MIIKKTHSALLVILTLALMTNSTSASELHWKNTNTFEINDMTLQRPNERWRVLQVFKEDLIDFKLSQNGEDAVIRFFEKSGLSKPFTEKNWNSARLKKNFKRALFQEYESRGYHVGEFSIQAKKISAKISNATNDKVLFVTMALNPKDIRSKIRVVEMEVKSKQAEKFSQAFTTASQGIVHNTPACCAIKKNHSK